MTYHAVGMTLYNVTCSREDGVNMIRYDCTSRTALCDPTPHLVADGGAAAAKGDSFCLGQMPPPLAQPSGNAGHGPQRHSIMPFHHAIPSCHSIMHAPAHFL